MPRIQTSLAIVAALLMTGCGTAPLTTPVTPAAPTAPAALNRPVAAPMHSQSSYQAASAGITYRNPEYPLHSDKFEFKSGRFLPLDDGMGPLGDTEFFYDGRAFFVVTNNGGGSKRGIAAATDAADPHALTYHQGPLPLKPGDSFVIQTPDGYGYLLIDDVSTGSMRLTPEDGSGSGSVGFRYRLVAD